MIKTPLVSVIIPTYNRPYFLALTLDSVFAQTYKNFEVIVIDDGTTNDKNKIICEQYSQIKYFKISNSGGPSRPRNIGITKARGKYIAFVDDDDIWLPTKLEEQVQVLNKHLDFGLVHNCCQVINKNGKLTGTIIGRPGSPEVKHGDVKMKMVGNWTLMMPTPLLRKSVIDEVGFFNEQMPQAGEDVEFWVRCSFLTKFYYIDKPLVLYRKHESNSKKLEEQYIQLPIYLKIIIDNVFIKHIINKKQHSKLVNNLVRMQIKGVNDSYIKTIINLYKLNPFWFLKFGNIKLFIKKLIS